MRKPACILLIAFYLTAARLQAAVAPHIGFAYPAGGLPGTTFSVTIGGQYLKVFAGIHVSGLSVTARQTDYLRIYEQREIGRIRRTKETLDVRMSEEKDATTRQQIQRMLEQVDQEMQQVLAISDDAVDKSIGLATHHADARIDVKLPMNGTYYIRLDDAQGKGGADVSYRMTLAQEKPDVQLRLVPASLRIPKEGSVVATVHALRTGGFSDEITVSLTGAPSGLELRQNVIPAGATKASIVIAATPQAKDGLYHLQLEGTASCGGHPLHRPVVPAEDMMQAFFYRHLVSSQQLLVQVAPPDPVTVTLLPPDDGIYGVRAGSSIRIRSQVTWRDDSRRGIKLALVAPPEWLTLITERIQPRGGDIILNISSNAEVGDTATVLLNGTLRMPKDASSPDYNPIAKWMNNTDIEFAIGAIPVTIIE